METINKIKSLPYFSKASLATVLGKKSPNTLKNYLVYWGKKGELIPLKKGLILKNGV